MDAMPLAVGFQCGHEGCGVLLPLTAYPPAAQGKSLYASESRVTALRR
jgi:hypothetical protein